MREDLFNTWARSSESNFSSKKLTISKEDSIREEENTLIVESDPSFTRETESIGNSTFKNDDCTFSHCEDTITD